MQKYLHGSKNEFNIVFEKGKKEISEAKRTATIHINAKKKSAQNVQQIITFKVKSYH